MRKIFSTPITIFLSVIVFSSIVISSCSDTSNSSVLIYSKDGVIYNQANDKPYTGRITDTTSSKIIMYDVKDGLKNGEFIIYFLNGKIAMYGKIKDNKNEGKWSYYYPNGKLESQGLFKNDIVINKWTWYYSNGQKKEEGNFVDGKREGAWKMYKKDGTLKSTVFFKEGNVVNTIDLSHSPIS